MVVQSADVHNDVSGSVNDVVCPDHWRWIRWDRLQSTVKLIVNLTSLLRCGLFNYVISLCLFLDYYYYYY